MTTTDLSKFGWREKKMAAALLHAACNGLPSDFCDDEVTIMMNTHSGNVFLTNSEHQVAMLNGFDLVSFYSCPVCGHEGFANEMKHNEENLDCQEYLVDIGVKKEGE